MKKFFELWMNGERIGKFLLKHDVECRMRTLTKPGENPHFIVYACQNFGKEAQKIVDSRDSCYNYRGNIMGINVIGNYRLAFIKPGQVQGYDVVNIDFTPTPSPFSPWPKRNIGKVTTSVAALHNKSCDLMQARDSCECRCPRWIRYLRAEIKGVK